MMWGWNNGGWQGNWWMGGMIFFWIAIIGLGIWLVVRLTDRHDEHLPKMDSPRTILDKRFANGELNAEQYAQARRLLESNSLSHKEL